MNNENSPADNDLDPNSISIEQAQQTIFATLPSINESETISVHAALGRVLASDIAAPINVPAFRASAMDGYAYRHVEGNQRLRVAATSLAGHPSADKANAAECHRITTGARIPDFADTVVQQENVNTEKASSDTAEFITISKHPALGHHVRPIGSNSKKGEPLMKQGQFLGAAQLASLTAQGLVEVQVKRQVKVAIFSTGDELTESGNELVAGNIFDANRSLLISMLQGASVVIQDIGIVEDSVEALEQAMTQCDGADVILSSGGVSVGDADFVRPVLEQMGKLHIWKIAVKPGRPLTFGLLRQQPYFGLPGNPVSAAVTCLLFVKPAISAMLGQPINALPRLSAKLTSDLKKLPGRVEYQRGILEQTDNGEWQVSTTGLQDSHVVTSLHKANCFIELGFNSSGAQNGEQVLVIPYSHFSEQVL